MSREPTITADVPRGLGNSAIGDGSVLRVGNASGFLGDRFDAVREMLQGGELDVLTGDYLAELTMLILGRQMAADPDRGYARTFLRQMEECLGLARDRGVVVVSNAGGLNPAALAAALGELAGRLGLAVRVAHVEGDDLRRRAGELGFGTPLTANAYLGAWGIAACLQAGADVVVTGRVTDASLVVGPAAAHFGWARTQWDALAGATVAGHVLECGAQATGGNFSFFLEHDVRHPGFPIAEIAADGSCVITKHAGTGGAVTEEIVTAQLLYETGDARYLGPDVVARLDSVELGSDGADRVRVAGVRGEPPPPMLKVCLNALGGFRNEATFVLCGLDIEAKTALVRAQVETALAGNRPSEVEWSLIRSDRPDAEREEEASALLRCSVKDADAAVVGGAFSAPVVGIALASYPGFHLTGPPREPSPYGVFAAAWVAQSDVAHVAVLPDGTRAAVEPPPSTPAAGAPPPRGVELPPPLLRGPCRRAPLGTVVGARSGDKGGAANIGVWARSSTGWRWLVHFLSVAELQRLLPETRAFAVQRHVFPNLRALNFVVDGLLGEGVASSTRFDPQAKAVGEWLRARHVDIPEVLL